MKSIAELEQMTTREIAYEAKQLIFQLGFDKAQKELQNHIVVINQKMDTFGKGMNKKYKSHRMPPKVRRLLDFMKFQ